MSVFVCCTQYAVCGLMYALRRRYCCSCARQAASVERSREVGCSTRMGWVAKCACPNGKLRYLFKPCRRWNICGEGRPTAKNRRVTSASKTFSSPRVFLQLARSGASTGAGLQRCEGLLLRCATRVSEEYVADVRDGGIRIMGERGGVYGGGRRDE